MKASANLFFGSVLAVGLTLASVDELTIVSGQRPKQSSARDYDYRSLSVDSIRDAIKEVKKLNGIEQRVKFVLSASPLLARFHKNEAIELLDVALEDLKEWASVPEAPLSRRLVAAELRSKILAQYAQLDNEKATIIFNQDKVDTPDADSKTFRANGNWRKILFERQSNVDAVVTLAISLLETDQERATALVVQSVQQGIVSLKLFQVFQKLRDTGNRARLTILQERVAQAIRSNVTLDFNSVTSASILAWDQDMSPTARASFVLFLFNSLETWVTLTEAAMTQGGLDPSYVDSMFVAFFLNVRPLVVQHSAVDVGRFDLLLDRVALQVSAKTKSLTSSAATVEVADPKDRLADIAKEVDAEKRDLRLLRFAVEILRKEVSEDQLGLLSDAVGYVKEPKLKASLGDFLSLKRVGSLVKAQKLNDAAKAAEAITTSELRAWALLALSSIVVNEDRFFAMTLVSNAMKSLDESPANPRAAEVAFLAAGLVSKDDPVRAFEILSLAIGSANAVGESGEATNNLAAAVMYEVSIGDVKIMPARPPRTLSDIRIDPRLALLARKDWFRVQKIVSTLKDPGLRLSFKLELAKAILEEPTTNAAPSPTGVRRH